MMTIADLIKAEIDNIPEEKLAEVYQLIKQFTNRENTFTQLWQKIDDLGEDEEQLSTEEIVSLVKEVREDRAG